uniref:(California timema) hypothetical protein n=1 Tax=Timema californicum TaxID=61474 RepID=A0A7R9JKR5_TIMCA|nr:unnamed protein product [Timema californicum]
MEMSSRRKKTQKIDMSDISKPIHNNKQQFSQESASRAYTSHLRESKGRPVWPNGWPALTENAAVTVSWRGIKGKPKVEDMK